MTSLGIGNLPNGTTSGALMAAFAPFGTIESARVLTHKNCGFVNFEQQEDAMLAKKSLQNKDIPGLGPAARIGYAKVPGNSTTSAIDIDASSNPSRTPQSSFTSHSGPPSLTQASPSMDAYHTRMMMMLMAEMAGGNPNNLAQATILERQYIMNEFGDDASDGPQFDSKFCISAL
jgi:RNA recognition motif-containing protein